MAIVVAVTATACRRDPNELKRKYVQTGNKYFAVGKYREASILYRSAIRHDARFAEAYYRWALAEIKLNKTIEALPPLRRAVELLPDGAESRDAKAKLADVLVYFLENVPKDNIVYGESQRLAGELLASESGAYDGHRLKARLEMLQLRYATQRGVSDQAKEHLAASIEEFRAAAAIKPFETDVLVPLARSLVLSGQIEKAEKIYLDLLEHDKAFVPGYGELYNLYLRGRRFDDAENILKRGLANNPSELLFLTNLANHYHGVHREQDALKMIEQLKVVGKGTPHLDRIVGAFYLKLGNREEAIRYFEAGMRTEPKEKNFYRKRIIEVLLDEHKNDDAGRIIEAVLKDDPKDSEARVLRGSSILQAGDFSRAAAELQAAVQTDLLNPIARYLLGSALAGDGQLALAIPELQKAMQLDPNYLEARLKLAQVQILAEQNEGALKTTQNILEDLDARNRQAKLLRAAALRNLNRLDEAREEIETVLKLQPNSPEALLQLGELCLSEKKFKEAEEAFRKPYDQDPRDLRGLLRIAELFRAKNEPGRALQILRAESSKHPERLDLRKAVADTAARVEDYRLAIAEYQAILGKLDPKIPFASEIHGALGEAYRANGQYELALNELQKAREGLPKDSAVLSNLAVTLLRLGRSADAKQLYESTFSLQGENPIALNNLAYLIAEKNGDLDTALTFAQRARQKWPHVDEISDTLAWIYLKKNLNDNAIEILENIVNKKPNQPTFRYHLGAAWLQKGNKTKAKKELEMAMANSPSQEELGRIRELLAKSKLPSAGASVLPR